MFATYFLFHCLWKQKNTQKFSITGKITGLLNDELSFSSEDDFYTFLDAK